MSRCRSRNQQTVQFSYAGNAVRKRPSAGAARGGAACVVTLWTATGSRFRDQARFTKQNSAGLCAAGVAAAVRPPETECSSSLASPTRDSVTGNRSSDTESPAQLPSPRRFGIDSPASNPSAAQKGLAATSGYLRLDRDVRLLTESVGDARKLPRERSTNKWPAPSTAARRTFGLVRLILFWEGVGIGALPAARGLASFTRGLQRRLGPRERWWHRFPGDWPAYVYSSVALAGQSCGVACTMLDSITDIALAG